LNVTECYYCHQKEHFALEYKTQVKDEANGIFQKSIPKHPKQVNKNSTQDFST
jgi:hypothetical protein